MEEIGTVCCQFQILRENCDLNIQYSIIECFKHSFEKAIVYLSNKKNIDIMTEREKFQDIPKNSLLKSSDWYFVPTYAQYRVNAKWFDYSYFVKFVLKRKTNTEN